MRAKAALYLLGASAAVVLSTTCGVESSAPIDTVDPEQTAGAAAPVDVARIIKPRKLGLANPAGLAFSPRAGTFLLITRAPGTPATTSTGVELLTLAASRAGTVRIPAEVSDPVNLTFDARANRLLILQAAHHQLIEIQAGPDGSLEPEALTRIDVRSFGLDNPQGVTVDPATGRLFILDAAGPRIVVVTPHAQLGFAGASLDEIDLASTGWTGLRGLAFDPTNEHLHVLEPEAHALHELNEAGTLVATRDLSAFTLRNPQGMTFAPSGDATDDPAEQSLYVADGGLGGAAGPGAKGGFAETGHITELSLIEVTAAPAAVTAGSLLRTVLTSQFSPASPDPSGIDYVAHLGRLVIGDGEVDEMSIYRGANMFEMSLTGGLVRSWTSTSFSDEPVGVAYNPANRYLFLSDDTGTRSVYQLNPGADGLYGTAGDVVTSLRTADFGSSDPEGVAYGAPYLFVVDGVNAQVYRVSPGGNGVFDGVSPQGDDQVTSFDTERLGLTDPEGIAYDSDYGHLYLVGKPADLVFQVTTTGTLIGTIDISAANARKPAGLAYVPNSVIPGGRLWIVDRGVDNDSNPNENDGKAYEFSLPSSGGNAIPTVTITGPANGATFSEGAAITFSGTASDVEDGNLTSSLTWTSSVNGTIGTGGSFSTSALSLGSHTITARVTDGGGAEGSAAIAITVNPEGVATLEVRVAASADDAEESPTGVIDLTSSDLELVNDGGDQTVGMRFNGVTIPHGAAISNAYVQFQVDEADTEATSLTIRGDSTDNAATFTTATGNISSRRRTASAVSWSPVPWSTVGAAGPDQRTPNIAAIIQEIVNRAGWSSGNSLAIIITGTGHRTAESFNGLAAAAPLLHVDYVVGGGGSNAAPTATNVAISGTAQVGQVLTGTYTYSDADGDPQGASTYRWLRNGTPINLATAATYTLVAADQGALIVFEVTPVATTGASPGAPAQSAAVGPVQSTPTNSAPTATNVAIAGTPQVGQVLTGTYTYGDVDGDPEGTSTYRWLRDGAPINLANATTYTLVADDQGAMIGFEVTPVAASGASPGTAVQSSAVGPVAAAPTVIVTAITPNTMVSGSSMSVTITGTGFAPGATVTFSGSSGPTPIAVNVVVVNATAITATITTKAGGPPRKRQWDARATNPDGSTGVLVGGLTVTP